MHEARASILSALHKPDVWYTPITMGTVEAETEGHKFKVNFSYLAYRGSLRLALAV